jgi:hypothetical protein
MGIKKHVERLERLGNEERGEYIIRYLEKLGMSARTEEYEYKGDKGMNIIAGMDGKEEYEILVSAHYDRVEKSPGANDNASGVAVLLSVLEKLKDYNPKGKIRFIFFDDEEDDCGGSKHFVSSNKLDNIKGLINLEVCGIGDVVHIGTYCFKDETIEYDEKINKIIKKASEDLGYGYVELPTPPSDHLNFLNKNIPATCFSCLPADEIETARKFMEGSKNKPDPINDKNQKLLEDFGIAYTPRPPDAWKFLHTPEDKSIYIKEGSLKMMVDVLIDTIIAVDRTVSS